MRFFLTIITAEAASRTAAPAAPVAPVFGLGVAVALVPPAVLTVVLVEVDAEEAEEDVEDEAAEEEEDELLLVSVAELLSSDEVSLEKESLTEELSVSEEASDELSS